MSLNNRSPWNPSRVYVAGRAGAYENTLRALAGMDLSAAKGKKVLLKPNAGRIAEADSGVTTHPDVVAAAIDAFLDAGAQVSVGESPITGVKTMEAFDATGIAAVAKDRKCRLIDMDAGKPVTVRIPNGAAIHTITVCADVMDHDLVVSMPVAKTHMHTGVTLSVKNMKGCLWRRSKVDLHMLPAVDELNDRSLDIAIADMASVLRPHLAIVDGTVGMEGLGPSAGDPRELNVVVVGADAFAVDAVTCRLMGMNAGEVPHLRIGSERGRGIIDLDRIHVTPADWESFCLDFAAAPESISIKYPNVEVLDVNSCSACQSTVLLFLQRHAAELFDYFGPDNPVRIAIGKGHDDVPAGTLCIGNCTDAHRDKGVFVAGCPPVGSAILRALDRDRK
jgi:uncharacterized protein (DUF362 family)